MQYPEKYIHFLESFLTDDIGNIIRNDKFIKEYGYMEFLFIQGSDFKETEKINTLRSKLRRLARLFIYVQNVASELGVEVKGCHDMLKVKRIT